MTRVRDEQDGGIADVGDPTAATQPTPVRLGVGENDRERGIVSF